MDINCSTCGITMHAGDDLSKPDNALLSERPLNQIPLAFLLRP